jgi:hypothetical protein
MSRRRSATTSAAAPATTAPPNTSSPCADWQKEADESLAAYVGARARAAGFDEESVALALAWLPRRAPDSPIVINERRIEMHLCGEVLLVMRRFICPDYERAPGSIRCRSFVAGGGCLRPEHPVCVEWGRANPDR